MKTVDIAMATYNGGKFLEEQILSIQKQTYTNWKLYISDDGSTDNTLEIIEQFTNDDQRIKLINIKRQGGVIANFNMALKSTNSDYICLCDQDDIWPSSRLEILVHEIQKQEKVDFSKGILVFSDLELVDQNGNTIADSFYEANRLNPKDNLIGFNLLWISTVYGCTTIMNRKLLDIALPIPCSAQMHDQWLALNAQKNDGLYYLDSQTIRYRQHDNNVVGGAATTFFGRIRKFKRNLRAIHKLVINIKETLKYYEDLYYPNKKFNNYYDFLEFSVKEIFPKIFFGKKKVQALFIFLGMLFIK